MKIRQVRISFVLSVPVYSQTHTSALEPPVLRHNREEIISSMAKVTLLGFLILQRKFKPGQGRPERERKTEGKGDNVNSADCHIK
jgi:hypothetical protein